MEQVPLWVICENLRQSGKFLARIHLNYFNQILTGHSLGVAGVHEAIYTILMLHHDFISPSINIENIDENAEDFNIVTDLIEEAGLETVMSNSFGFGGTNASLVFKK